MNNHLSSLIFTGLFAISSLTTLSADESAQTQNAWVAEESMQNNLAGDSGTQILPKITITSTPKKTANVSQFTKKYTIEPEKFGIHTDGTSAAETSKGINDALEYAKEQGFNYLLFPKGTYLIDVENPVVFKLQDTIVDLNGSTFQAATNGKTNYAIAQIDYPARNFRLTNGTISGDRMTHDYEAAEGTHEGGTGLRVYGGSELEIDHLTFTLSTGDGINTSSTGAHNRDDLLGFVYKYWIRPKDVERGAFSDKGEKIDSDAAFRLVEPLDLTQWGGAFELGWVGGYQGFPHIKGRVYEVLFFDENHTFTEKRQELQYRKVQIPSNAHYATFQFNQSELSETPAHGGWAGHFATITNVRPPVDVHLHDNVMSQNRRLGLTVSGGQRWVIENNRFENNGTIEGSKGTAPAYGVDYEDGWDLVYDIVFRKNTFQGNQNGDLVVSGGTELLFEDNTLENNLVIHARTHNYTFRNNKITGGFTAFSTRTGVADIHDNTYSDQKRFTITFDTKGVADGLVRKEGQKVATPPLLFKNETLTNIGKVEGTYFNFENSHFSNVEFLAGDTTALIRLVGNTFESTTLKIRPEGTEFSLIEKENSGELATDGATERIKQSD